MIIRSEEIYNKANSIVKSCGTRDTLKIARKLGIYVHQIDTLNDLLGMYIYRHKERHILLNSGMEHMVMQMVCGHEIGHDMFHRDLAKKETLCRSLRCSICVPNRNMRQTPSLPISSLTMTN